MLDACPSRAVFEAFSASPGFRTALAEAGLASPRIEPLGDVRRTLPQRRRKRHDERRRDGRPRRDRPGGAGPQSGEVTAVELVEWAIERIEQLNPRSTPWSSRSYEQALADGGDRPTDAARSLGCPSSLKDLVVGGRGHPVRRGLAVPARNVSTYTSELVPGCAGPGW